MTDMRRALLWVVFSASLILLWDGWNKHNGQPSLFAPPPAATSSAAPPQAASGVPGALPQASADLPGAGASAAAAASPGAVPATPAPAAIAGEKITVTTDVVKATFDSIGGSLVRLELLKYADPIDAGKRVVLFDDDAQHPYLAQTGLVGVPSAPNHLTPMVVAPGPRELADGKDDLVVRFESPVDGGLKLVKTYTLHRSSYVIDVKHEIENDSAVPVAPQLYAQLTRHSQPPEGTSRFYSTFTGPAVYTDEHKYQKVDFKKIDQRKPGEAPDHATRASDGWVAMVQHYFASAWLHNETTARDFYTRRVDGAPVPEYSVGELFPLGTIAPGKSVSFQTELYAGPQEERKLSALAPGLELVKDYGMFKIIAKPMFWLLYTLHSFIGNWGWSIVALVVILKAAFFWLNASAYKSMAKMKAINPRVMELRERYKDKPQQLQQEMMRIYREEKVNPIGGCLPIFVQMPFFIALYWVLLSTVEMRNAPWIGWIHDLSAMDPFYILPLLMTASTMLQTWLNPTPPDPVQAKMMWIMPLAFSVMFFFFPAGLVLYWLTNNLLSIAQQWVINKKLGVNK